MIVFRLFSPSLFLSANCKKLCNTSIVRYQSEYSTYVIVRHELVVRYISQSNNRRKQFECALCYVCFRDRMCLVIRVLAYIKYK